MTLSVCGLRLKLGTQEGNDMSSRKYTTKQLKQVGKDADKGRFPQDHDLWYAYMDWKSDRIYINLFIWLSIAASIYIIPANL